jgi:hypothetical protein
MDFKKVGLSIVAPYEDSLVPLQAGILNIPPKFGRINTRLRGVNHAIKFYDVSLLFWQEVFAFTHSLSDFKVAEPPTSSVHIYKCMRRKESSVVVIVLHSPLHQFAVA